MNDGGIRKNGGGEGGGRRGNDCKSREFEISYRHNFADYSLLRLRWYYSRSLLNLCPLKTDRWLNIAVKFAPSSYKTAVVILMVLVYWHRRMQNLFAFCSRVCHSSSHFSPLYCKTCKISSKCNANCNAIQKWNAKLQNAMLLVKMNK